MISCIVVLYAFEFFLIGIVTWINPDFFDDALDFDLARGAEALHISELGKALQTIKAEGPDGYGEEIRYALECVAERRRPAIVTARDGVTALEICEAEEQSIRTGEAVKL